MPAPSLSAYSVMVVDDNPANLTLIEFVLEATGCRMLLADGAASARRMLQASVPDLILMDIAMPEMDGLALTRLLKADPRLQHVPIVALTAFAMEGDERKALEAGCAGYITKPIDTRTLPDQVAEALHQGREGAQR